MGTEKLEEYKKREDAKRKLKENRLVKFLLPAERFIHMQILRPVKDGIYCVRRDMRFRRITADASKMTANESTLAALKDSHKGETAFVIGNGPSLKAEDLDLLKEYGAYSFACNRISLIFDETAWRPTCYAAIDRKLLFSESFAEDMIRGQSCEYYFFWKKFYECMPKDLKQENVISIEQKPTNPFKTETDFSAEPLRYLISGYTVTNLSIQMAVYMGFTTICLLGIDCRYANVMDARGNITHNDDVRSYFKVSSEKTNQNTAFVDGMLQAYIVAKKYADEHGINIYNCSKDSCLEVFERADLRTFLETG